jgi:hypothetical protein
MIAAWISLAVFAALFIWAAPRGLAASPFQAPTPTPAPTSSPAPGEAPLQLSIGNDVCLGCHGKPGATMTLDNGDILDLSISPDDYSHSVHGEMKYACVQCHTRVGNYPHPPFKAADLRDVTLQLYQTCQRCHAHQFELAQDGVHATAILNGNLQAAVCTDCHTAHAVRRLNDPKTHKLLADARIWIPQTCEKCHSEIYNKYKESVHGAALIDKGNQDVPTCIDCHGVHNIEDPRTAYFRLNSPQLCAKCHTDPKIMDKYGISTDVLSTYVSDFHGTTVVLFEKMSPDAQTNKPVCFDCHGVHDIAKPDDPVRGLAVRDNLLKRCQVCHPDATANFPTAWLSHYIPSPEKNPLVYYVNLFYKFFIPGTLGGMALLVALDLSKRARNRFFAQQVTHRKAEPEISEPTAANEAAETEPGEGFTPASAESAPPEQEEEVLPPPNDEEATASSSSEAPEAGNE